MNIHQQRTTREFMSLADVHLDPWEQQTKLMSISGQTVALTPQLNTGVLTYIALMLEEFGETLGAFSQATLPPPPENSQEAPFPALLRALSPVFAEIAGLLHSTSVGVRHAVADLGPATKRDASIPLQLDDAVALLDGLTDIHVVTAGCGISAGLPGASAYDEIVGSNLSKADPVSGRIQIDASGKWIKGANYRAPNLAALLQHMLPEVKPAEAEVMVEVEPLVNSFMSAGPHGNTEGGV